MGPLNRRCGSSRRQFLGQAAGAAAAMWAAPEIIRAAAPGPRLRPDLLDKDSPAGLEVLQLTTESDVPSSHLYMEAQIFTLDSKRLVLHRAASAHGRIRGDKRHQYLRCDLDDRCSLHPLTDEAETTAATVSPDGKYLYYFVDESTPGGGRILLKRVNLDGTGLETLMTLDGILPDSKFRPSRLYPLSTISSDGKRLAISCFFGDGQTAGSPWGLMVFDLVQATVRAVMAGPSWCNMHPQYCRSLDPQASHDILIQENHDNEADARGVVTKLVGGQGADIHVIRDDGTNFRTLPWGRDGNESCQGHQCWRGRTTWAVTSTGTRKPPEAQLIEGAPLPDAGHLGIKTPGGKRNDLSREFPKPQFYHFATDLAGERFISDAGPYNAGGRLFVAEFGAPGKDPLRNFRYLLSPRSSCKKEAHIHPFLSPDGKLGFFNSDESGILQAYMVRGFW